jgi:hypothetical protein
MMPKVTRYNLPATGGAAVNIVCMIPCRRAELQEDGSAALQGFTFTFPDGTVQDIAPTQEPLVLGDKVAHGHGRGALLGLPAQNGMPFGVRAADVYGKATSMTGTPVTLIVTEYE